MAEPQIPDIVQKLIPRLASTFDGERLATVAAIERALRAQGCDWHDLAKAVGAGPVQAPRPQPESKNKPRQRPKKAKRPKPPPPPPPKRGKPTPKPNECPEARRARVMMLRIRDELKFCGLTNWEKEFSRDMLAKPSWDELSEKQKACILKIIRKVFPDWDP